MCRDGGGSPLTSGKQRGPNHADVPDVQSVSEKEGHNKPKQAVAFWFGFLLFLIEK